MKLNYLFLGLLLIFCQQLYSQETVRYSTHINSSITVNIPLIGSCTTHNLKILTQPKHAKVSNINATGGLFVYKPDTNFTGTDSLQYSTNCGTGWAHFIVAPYPDNVISPQCQIARAPTKWNIQQNKTTTAPIYICAQPLVGDIDNDGKNEVITLGYSGTGTFLYVEHIVIFDNNLVEKATVPVPTMFVAGGLPVAIADVDKDGLAEIFIHAANGYLHCFNFDGVELKQKWVSSETTSAFFVTANLIIADINADGIPDILALDKIYNSLNGKVEAILPSSPFPIGGEYIYYGNNGSGYGTHSCMPVFADMDNDGILEVVGGNNVIKVDIKNANNATKNTAVVWKELTNMSDGFTSVADIDLDGYLDVVVVSNSVMYVWKPYTGIGSTPKLLDEVPYLSSFCGSKPLIGDLDNDGYSEIAWTYSFGIEAQKYNPATKKLDQLWWHQTSDNSGSTGITVFDFNSDGSAEVVYRDGLSLRIMEGVTGNDINTIPCYSATAIEYPIIVDLDKTGEAQIIVSETTSLNFYEGRLCSFKSSDDDKWTSARSVWNQYAYSTTHINNDLTVPQYPLNLTTVFTDSSTTPPTITRPYNNSMQQQTYINEKGIPVIPAADITYTYDNFFIACDSVKIKLNLYNKGHFLLNSPFGITVYNNFYQGEVIHTETINTVIPENDTIAIQFAFSIDKLPDIASITDLVVVLNDNGMGVAQHGNLQNECDTINNIITFPFILSPLNDTIVYDTICQGTPYNDKGFNIPADSNLVAGVKHHQLRFPLTRVCDSVVKLQLTINPTYDTTINVNACNFFTFQDSTYTKSGFYNGKKLLSIHNCDSITNLNLTINSTYYSTLQVESCPPYKFKDTAFTKSGTYTIKLESPNKCDTIITLNLTILPSFSVNIIGDICEQEKIILEANTQATSLLWSTGDTTHHPHSLEVHHAGNYWAKALTYNCVENYIDVPFCNFTYSVPNAIIPFDNSDANRYFQLFFKKKPELVNFEIYIYNRWGNLVFQSKDPYFKWNGQVNGQTPINVAYTYVINFLDKTGNSHTRKGVLNVIE